MKLPTLLLPALVLLAFVVPAPATSQEIVALCIGNDAYHNPDDLFHPMVDETWLKRTLEPLPGGADNVLLSDASREDIVIGLNSLVSRSRGAKLGLDRRDLPDCGELFHRRKGPESIAPRLN